MPGPARAARAVPATLLSNEYGQTFRHDPTDPTGARAIEVACEPPPRDAPVRDAPPPLARLRAAAHRVPRAAPFYLLVAVCVLLACAHTAPSSPPAPPAPAAPQLHKSAPRVHVEPRGAQQRGSAAPAGAPSLPLHERRIVFGAPHGIPSEVHLLVPAPEFARVALTLLICVALAQLRLHGGFEAGFLAQLFRKRGARERPALARVGSRRLCGVLSLRALLWYAAVTVSARPHVFNQDVLYRHDSLPGDPSCKQRVSDVAERANLLWTIGHCAESRYDGTFYTVRVAEAAHSADGRHHVCFPGTDTAAVGRVRLTPHETGAHIDLQQAYHFPLPHFHAFCRNFSVACGDVTRIASRGGATYVHHRDRAKRFVLDLSNGARPGVTVLREAIDALQKGLSLGVATRNALAAHVELRRSSCFGRSREPSKRSLRADKLVLSLPWVLLVVLVEYFFELASNVGPEDMVDTLPGTEHVLG